MRSEEEYQKALRLIDEGVNDSAIGRELGIPRSTIRDWRVGIQAELGGRTKSRSSGRTSTCFRCTGGSVDEEAYSYLLGVYLGDGYLSPHPRGVYRLRISCDLKYPGIINEIATHIVIVRGTDAVGFTSRTGCVEVYAYWKHWPCLFPQHGPGRKHERPIELVSWQRSIVDNHLKALIRGLIQSDGNRHINQVTRKLASGPKRYRYPRYMFTNASTDILEIFTDALDMLGVHWTRTTARDVSVARRADVAFLDTFVGPKR
ncbi:MAG: helix-turn-helix domain-containing protein [Actinomycetota bacterium]|nr:helix-turn-helix domain-containing protein [Actinomycetota bacterium]